MSKKVLTNLDFGSNQILNVLLQQLASDPGAPSTGQIWYRTDQDRPKWRSSSATNDIYPMVSTSTANTAVLRDGSGNFSAGTITATLTGTASQATTLYDGVSTYQSGSYYLNFANSTGTRTHTAISDFDTQVRLSRLDQMAAPTASVSFNSQNITNLLDPVNPQDAATKHYVDATAQGLTVKNSVIAATTTTLPAYTFAATAGGTLTASANGAFAAVDGVTLTVNQRLLVKNETGANQPYNGIYTLTTVGTGGTPWVLTRSTDANVSADVVTGMFVFVDAGGTTNANSGWILTTTGAITLNTTNLSFAQFSATGSLTAGNGITIAGSTISASLAGRLAFTGSTIDLQSGVVSTGTYTSVTVDTYGRVTAGADIVSATGIVAKTASGTFTARTITGTASVITVTNGDGVAGAPTITISGSYVGQTSITTLGTITTGTWTGTTIAVLNGGTGATTANAGFNNLSPMTTLGDIIYGGTSGAGTRLAGNITTTKQFLSQTGGGATSAAPVWGALVAGDIPNLPASIITSGVLPIARGGTNSGTTLNNNKSMISSGGAIVESAIMGDNGTTVSVTGIVTLAPAAVSSGVQSTFVLTGASNTNMTASTEVVDFNLNLNRTVQWATGGIATQRAVLVSAPIYAFVASSTITTAATFAISGAPTAGTNGIIGTAYALWVQSGATQVQAFNATTINGVGALTLSGAPAIVAITQQAASSGSPIGFSFIGGAHTTLTASVEANDFNLALNRTVQFATSTPTTQRAVFIQAPTYACNTAAQTIANAATFAIAAAPTAGTNVTLTNSWALWVQAGSTQVQAFNATTINGIGTLTVTGATSLVSLTQAVATSGSPTGFSYTGGAHTTLTASVEANDVNWALNRQVQFATGGIATQRAFLVQAPTYAFVGSSTITTAATFAIAGAPVAGTNAILSASYALWVQSGATQVQAFNATTINGVGAFTLTGAVGIVSITQSAASSGNATGFLFTGGAHTTLTSAAEAIDVSLALNRTVQWATSTPTTQRAILIQAPTYACNAVSQTITNAATFAIASAPTAGTNVTLTNAWALWVQAGSTQVQAFNATSITGVGALTVSGATALVSLTQLAASSGSPTGFTFTGGAHTTLASGAEAIDVNWALNRTVQFATSTPGTQRAFLVQAPTYSCNTASQTIATAATLAISGAPAAGTNVTITNAYALWVQAGNVNFGGTLTLGTALSVANGGTGLTSTSSHFVFIGPNGSTGAPTWRALVAADLPSTLVNKFSSSIGDGSTTSFTVTHNLGTLDVVVAIYDNSSLVEVLTDVTHATTNTLTVAFATAPTTNQYRVVVVG